MTKQKPNPKSPPVTVATLTELAAYCGVSVTTARTWKGMFGFPIEVNKEYSPFRIGQWHAMRMVSPSKPTVPEGEVGGGDDDDDEDNPKVSSPMLERLREEKWRLAKMDRQEREQALVSRERIHAFVMMFSGLLRGWVDRLQRKHGEEVYDSVVSILEDIERETEREFGDDDETEDSTQSV